jgi:plastocyanin
MLSRNRCLAAAIVLSATYALSACGGGTRAASVRTATAVVTLKNIAFHPAVVRIKAGQSVTWRWEDGDIDTEHNVTSIGRARFASSQTKMEGTYTVTFTHKGTYRFECTIHPQSMQGTVVVH